MLYVALHESLLTAGLRRLHLETLDYQRVDVLHHDGHERPQPHSDDGQHPALAPDVVDEQSGSQHSDDHQQIQHGQPRILVGVAHPVHHSVGRSHEVVAIQEIPSSPHQSQHSQNHRQMRLHRRRHPLPLRLEAYAAVDVVIDGGNEENHQNRREKPIHHRRPERQLKHIKADVGVELRILDAEALPIGDEYPLLPQPSSPRPHNQSEERSDERAHQPLALACRVVPAAQNFLFRPGRAGLGREPVGDVEAGEDQSEEHPDGNQGDHYP